MRSIKLLFCCLSLLLLLTMTACGGETPSPDDELVVIPTLPAATAEGGAEETMPTATVQPTADSIASPTPQASPTADASPTPFPTPTGPPTPATNPPVQAVPAAPLPETGRDLFYLSQGDLRLWDSAGRTVNVLFATSYTGDRQPTEDNPFGEYVGDVTAYELNGSGERMLAARLVAQEALRDDETMALYRRTVHELLFVDTVARETWVLVPRVYNLQQIGLSPDANQFAFVAQSLEEPTTDMRADPPQTMFVGPTNGGSGGPITAVSDCDGFCSRPVWHIESNLVAWGDRAAVWLHNIAGSDAQRIVDNQFEQNTGNIVIDTPDTWANNGRYLLMWRGFIEGGKRMVLDVPTATIVDVPDTNVYIDPFPAQVSWMPDSRLFILRSDSGGQQPPTAELWRVQLEDATLMREEVTTLVDQPAGGKGQAHLADGRFGYALFDLAPNTNVGGLYLRTSLTDPARRVNAVPQPAEIQPFMNPGTVVWSPDGAGALIYTREFSYYAPVDGAALYDVTAVLGTDMRQPQWRP